MDKEGFIYELSDEDHKALNLTPESEDQQKFVEVREDVARLEGYLRGRADSDRPRRGKGSNKDLVG